MTNLDSILKRKDITLPTNVHIVKAMVFPVVMYGCDSWTIKEAEHRRTDAFKRCWRRLLRVFSQTARRSNQSILMEISPSKYSVEGLRLKLKLQYLGHLMQRTDSFEKTLMLGKIESRRRREWQRVRWLDDVIDSMDMSLSKLQEMVKDRGVWLQSMGSQRVGYNWATEQQKWNHQTSKPLLSPFTYFCTSCVGSGVGRRECLSFLNIFRINIGLCWFSHSIYV